MPIMSAAEYTEKHARNLVASAPDIVAGINRVDKAPTEQAAAKVTKYLVGIQAAVQSGKWVAGLKRVSLEQWKKATADKGVPRISQGIADAAEKVNAFATVFLPFIDGVSTKTRAMPSMTLEDSIARMTAQVRGAAAFKR